MGSADPRAFARGKRAIAGSLVFIQFDSEPILDSLKDLRFLGRNDDLRPEYMADEIVPVATTSVVPVGGTLAINAPGNTTDNQQSQITRAGSDRSVARPWYADQIPPFDIVLTGANEYGYLVIMKILGVELMNQGFGVSIDDIVCEHSYTYIATSIVPWTSQGLHEKMIGQITR